MTASPWPRLIAADQLLTQGDRVGADYPELTAGVSLRSGSCHSP
jgi:hypothetical protein